MARMYRTIGRKFSKKELRDEEEVGEEQPQQANSPQQEVSVM